jgi:multisubunit Na+/H+ antiporter MnhG subunit
MDEAIAFLLRAMEENQIHARLAEEKRATIANTILILASSAIIALAFIGLNGRALPLTLLLVLLGAYGTIVTTKLYERSQFHILRARKLRARLDALYPNAQVEQLQKLAESEHLTNYRLFARLRLNTIWTDLYIALIMLGIVLSVLSAILR